MSAIYIKIKLIEKYVPHHMSTSDGLGVNERDSKSTFLTSQPYNTSVTSQVLLEGDNLITQRLFFFYI